MVLKNVLPIHSGNISKASKLRVSVSMLKYLKNIVIGIFTLFLLCIGGLYLFVHSLPDLCRDAVLAAHPSPNNKLNAVIFERDCATDFSTQVSILPRTSALEEYSSIFVADTNHGAAPAGQGGGPEVRITWLSDTQLQIQHHKMAHIIRAETKSEEVEVGYDTF